MPTEMETLAREQFAFLKMHGFTARVSTRRSEHATTIIYRHPVLNRGVGVVLYPAQHAIDIIISELEEGNWPAAFHTRYHQPLEELVSDALHVKDPLLQEMKRLRQAPERDEAAMMAWLAAASALARCHIDAITARPLWRLYILPDATEARWMGAAKYQIEVLALGLFEDLMLAYGAPSPPWIDHSHSLITIITWPLGDVAFQLGFDWRDCDVNCRMQGLIDGKIPRRYWEHWWQYRQLVQQHVGDDPALSRLQEINQTPFSECGYRYAEALLLAYHDLVARTLDEILIALAS